MSASALHFTPRAELGPQENLQDFIEICKQSDVLQARTQFESNVWDLGHRKGYNTVLRVVFSTHEAAKQSEPEPVFPQPFLDFAKAAIVYLQDQKPVVSTSTRIAALRCLEAALREWSKGSRPTAVNVEVLDTAVELAKKRFNAPGAYRVAGQLKIVAGLMRSKAFISLRQPWVPGIKKPKDLGSRVSNEAVKARQEKLPSAAALRALAYIFHEATKPFDILVSSYTALMLCAPERINEVLRLRRNCLVEGEGRFAGTLRLRWPGSKLAEDTTKALPTTMAPLAREAVSNLLKVTSTAQKIAAWYTANTKSLFLHKGASHLRGKELLTLREIALVLWGDEGLHKSAASWARATNGLESQKIPGGNGHRIGYRFADVEKAVLKMLPSTFPYVPGDPQLRCMDAMSVVNANANHSEKTAYLCMFDCVDYQTISSSLAGYAGKKTIFERFSYTEDDGTAIVVNSHSLRHYLNMLAQTGGLGDALIAILSGRKDVRQNRAYDHRTSEEVQEPISRALKAGFTGTLVPASSRDLVVRDEFKSMGVGAAHTTEFGWCMHNFASEPCQMYRDCINCEEQECIKGEAQKVSNLRQLKEETQYLLQQAREALSDEEYGADNWVKHQTLTLERVSALLAIMDDDAVPQGAQVRLNLSNAPLITIDNVRPIKFIRTRVKKAL